MPKYKKYPSYKDSGVEWLGNLPSSWNIKRLKNIIRANITDGPHETPIFRDEGISFLSVDGIQNGELTFKKSRYISYEAHKLYSKKANVEKDDILLGKAASIGKVARVKVDFEFSIWSPLALIKPKLSVVMPSYLEYLLKSSLTQYQIQQLSTSNTQQNISMADIPKFVFSIPDIKEQKTIATYLDRATAKIDTLIAKQSRLIELLREKRQALISTAVTRGLDPDVPMKDSGVAWLGEIPEGWVSSPLKFLLLEPLLYGANESADRNNPNDPRYIRITDIKTDGTLHNNTFRSLPMEIAQPYLLKNNSLLLARSGATVGKTFLYDDSWGVACFAGYLIKATILTSKANAKFVSYFTKTTNYWQWLNSSQIKATIENVSAEKYANLAIPLPSVKEQLTIVEYLDKKTKKIDTLITKATQAIELLKERRTALISAVVTGKVDVREAS